MGKEIELKLTAAPQVLSMATRQPWLRAMATGNARTEKLVSVYFDTPDCDLRRHHVALRIRKAGRRRLQTIKAAGGMPGTLEREEWEQEIDKDVPDLDLARCTPATLFLSRKKRNQLLPVFETIVTRTTLPLRCGDSEIELAIDRGSIRAGQRREHIGEFELELKDGDPSDLAILARKLSERFDLSFGALDKASRGYALKDNTRHAAVGAANIRLSPTLSCAAAFTLIGQSCLYHFAANEHAVADRDAEGIHQMRVGLRRLRAAISIFKEMLASRETEDIKAELKWLTDRLAPARTYDVLTREALVPLRKARPHASEIEMLVADMKGRRDRSFADAKAVVAGTRYRVLVLRAALWLLAGVWSQDIDPLVRARRDAPVLGFARAALGKRTRKVVKKCHKLKTLDPNTRHKLRIAVKKLRYATEFFAGLFAEQGKAQRQFESAVKSLQQALGKLNDIATHEKLAHQMAAAGSRSTRPAEAYAIGFLTGQEQKKVRGCLAAADKAAKKLSKTPPFW